MQSAEALSVVCMQSGISSTYITSRCQYILVPCIVTRVFHENILLNEQRCTLQATPLLKLQYPADTASQKHFYASYSWCPGSLLGLRTVRVVIRYHHYNSCHLRKKKKSSSQTCTGCTGCTATIQNRTLSKFTSINYRETQ